MQHAYVYHGADDDDDDDDDVADVAVDLFDLIISFSNYYNVFICLFQSEFGLDLS